ncbi:uncharacterized protein LOC116246078 [Nymphaea colorata]|nr:uncharacterized protein LOC116246078 [Nymphaea colorata]
MAIIGDALRQAFMPRHEYDNLREEEKAWGRIQRPLVTGTVALLWFAVLLSASLSLNIVFPADGGDRPLCDDRRIQPLPVVPENRSEGVELLPHAYYLTDEEAAQYYWVVVFIPSAILFLCSVIYLLAGMAVAYAAPARHACLRVVENNYCASKRGGVRCLSILNLIFAVVFGLLALFMGSSILTLASNCSTALFWCYEVFSWGLVILYGGTGLLLRRKAAAILDEGEVAGSRTIGLEMLEAPMDVTPEMARRANEGFKSWMGSSLLSSDDEEGPENW